MSSSVASKPRIFYPLLALGFLLASVLSVVALPVPQAAADDCGSLICGSPGGGGGGGGGTPPTVPDDPGNGNPPGGGTNPGGGGGSGGNTDNGRTWSQAGQGFFPRNPPATIGGTGPGDPGYTGNSNTYRYGSKCSGSVSWSANGSTYSARYIGWTWHVSGIWQVPFQDPGGPIDNELPYMRNATAGGYDCIDPPKYFDYQITCASYGEAQIAGPTKNQDLTGAQVREFTTKYSAFERSGHTNTSLCDRTYTFNFGSSPRAWGQYELTANAFVRDCTFRRYFTADERTGSVPGEEVVSCASPRKMDTDRARLELFCESPYVHKAWDNSHSFTTEDCREGSTWSCGPQVNQQPLFDGESAGSTPGFEVLDDGKVRRASWRTVQPTGDIRRITRKSATLRFIEGSPFRAGEPKNGNRQPYIVDPLLNTRRSGWTQASSYAGRTAWDLSWLAPGVSGEPFTVAPRWDFQAQFKSYVPNITWNLAANTYTYELVPAWITANATCDGQPLLVDVHRARNSTG